MKLKIFILFAYSFFAIATNAQWKQSWTDQNDYDVNQVFSVVNDSIIWVLGSSNNNISITPDKGNSWTVKYLPSFLSGNTGGLSAVNETTAYVICMRDTAKGLYKTSNGGNSWELQTTAFNIESPFPDFVYFWDANNGVAVGDAFPNENFEIYTTNNGGTLWNRVSSGNMPGGNYEATLAEYQDSYKVLGNSFYFVTNKGRIFKSLDKGLTWNVINTPRIPSASSFVFKDDNNGLYADESKQPAKLYSTVNGGLNWSLIDSTDIIGQLNYIPNQNIFISTSNDTTKKGLSYSSDNGLSWTSHPSFTGVGLGPCEVSPNGIVYVSGSDYIFSTTDITSSITTLATVFCHEFYFSQKSNKMGLYIISNTDWTVNSDQDWLTISSNIGSNNDVNIMTASANPDTLMRQATVTFSASGLGDQTIIVNQDAKSYLTVSSNSLSIGAQENSNNTFYINSNTSWAVVCNQAWLTINNSNNDYNLGYEGTYKATGTRVHPILGNLSVDIPNELITSIDGVNFQKSYAGDYQYQTQINITNNTLIVDGKIMLKVNVDITDTTLTTGSGMLETDSVGNPTNYYDPSTKTFFLSYFYNTEAPRNIYEQLVRDIIGGRYGTITLTADDNPAFNTRTATVTVSVSGISDQIITVTQDAVISGINAIENSKILFYPVPAKSILYLTGTQNPNVSIYDLSGKMVICKQINENKIDISSLANGFYSIKIVDKNGMTTKKFVKQ